MTLPKPPPWGPGAGTRGTARQAPRTLETCHHTCRLPAATGSHVPPGSGFPVPSRQGSVAEHQCRWGPGPLPPVCAMGHAWPVALRRPRGRTPACARAPLPAGELRARQVCRVRAPPWGPVSGLHVRVQSQGGAWVSFPAGSGRRGWHENHRAKYSRGTSRNTFFQVSNN